MLIITSPPLCIFLLFICLIILLLTVASVKVGPDFVRSSADFLTNWLEADKIPIFHSLEMITRAYEAADKSLRGC
jgi:hypothetical protein